MQQDHRYLESLKVLLKRYAGVDSQEYVEVILRTGEQLAILEARPTKFGDRAYIVSCQLSAKPLIDALVQQNLQLARTMPTTCFSACSRKAIT